MTGLGRLILSQESSDLPASSKAAWEPVPRFRQSLWGSSSSQLHFSVGLASDQPIQPFGIPKLRLLTLIARPGR